MEAKKMHAHFVELASALAIIDFLETTDKELECVGGKAVKPIYKELESGTKQQTSNFQTLKITQKEKSVCDFHNLHFSENSLTNICQTQLKKKHGVMTSQR